MIKFLGYRTGLQLSVFWNELVSEDSIPMGAMDSKGWEGRGGERKGGKGKGGKREGRGGAYIQ